MTRQRTNQRRLAVLLIVAGVVSAACGGSSPQNYFDDLADGTKQYAEAVGGLRDAYGEDLRSDLTALQDGTDFTDTAAVDAYFNQAKEVAIVKTADLFADTGAELRALIDALRALEPPEGVIPAHQDAVAAGEALAATMPVTIQAVRSLDSIEELQETIDESPFIVAAQRFSIACENLEGAATGAGIEVDLQCPDGITVTTE